MTRLTQLGVFCLCLVPAFAEASDPKPDRSRAALWTEVADPELQRAHELTHQAGHELAEAKAAFPYSWQAACTKLAALATPLDLPGFSGHRARVLSGVLGEFMLRLTHIENAIARLAEAHRIAPRDPDALVLLAVALREWERPLSMHSCHVQHRDREAIEAYETLRREHPTFQPAQVAFDLAIVYTRDLQFDAAARCYAEGAPLEIDVDQQGVLYSNWAEVTMLSGDLVTAVRLYRRAIDLATGRSAYLLPLWGLAVALDRLGEREAALEAATRALTAEAGSMAILHADGVFFEPESEIHYYEALGHEALSRMPGNDPDAELQRAAKSWRTFFEEGGQQTPWATSANDNRQRIDNELEQRAQAKAHNATRSPSSAHHE